MAGVVLVNYVPVKQKIRPVGELAVLFVLIGLGCGGVGPGAAFGWAWSDIFGVPFRHDIGRPPTPSGDCLIDGHVGDMRNALMAIVQSGFRWAVA